MINKEEIAKRIAASKAKRRKAPSINNKAATEALMDLGFRILHINNYPNNFEYTSLRKLTVAFRDIGYGYEVALVACNPRDDFSRKIGTKLVCERVLNDRTIIIPKCKASTAHTQMYRMFGYIEN